jgi:hypothetical protein
MVSHPDHYNPGPRDEDGSARFEAIKIIEVYDLGFCLGNAVKYILRAGRKGDALEDLRKAEFYLKRRISQLEAERNGKDRTGSLPRLSPVPER